MLVVGRAKIDIGQSLRSAARSSLPRGVFEPSAFTVLHGLLQLLFLWYVALLRSFSGVVGWLTRNHTRQQMIPVSGSGACKIRKVDLHDFFFEILLCNVDLNTLQSVIAD